MRFRIGNRFLFWLLLASMMSCVETDSPVIVDLNKPPPEPPLPAPDSIAPQPVDTLALVYSANENRLTLEWTAPCDDTPAEAVSQYEIRYSVRFPFRWEAATPVIDPPLPAPPGTSERYEFIPAHNGESLCCAVRCADEAGNRSPVSMIAGMSVPGFSFTGRCYDLFSGASIAGMEVTVIATDTLSLETDSEGYFRVDDLSLGPLRVLIAGMHGNTRYYDIDYAKDLVTHTVKPFPMIPVRFTIRNSQVSYLALFRAATEPCKGGSTELMKWQQRPVAVYIPHWVNENGIDYRVHAADALTLWMVRTRLDLFTIVDEPPDRGVIMHFKTREEMGSQIGITRHTLDPQGYPLRDDIDIVDDFAYAVTLYRIFLHEIGHTIRLCHLNFRDYIMYPGQPLPSDISDDEVEVVRMYEALPNGIDMSIYVDAQPE